MLNKTKRTKCTYCGYSVKVLCVKNGTACGGVIEKQGGSAREVTVGIPIMR